MTDQAVTPSVVRYRAGKYHVFVSGMQFFVEKRGRLWAITTAESDPRDRVYITAFSTKRCAIKYLAILGGLKNA